MPALDALQNAARLKASPSMANMANYEDIFAGPREGHVPSAQEQQTGAINQQNAATSLGASPAFMGLRHAAEGQRVLDIDTQLGQEADLDSGRPQHIASMQGDLQNDVLDQRSEGAAHRSFLPWAQDAQARDMETGLAQADARYGDPARVKAAGDVRAAQIGAEGRVGAVAQRNEGDMARGLYNAMNAIIANNGGKPPTPEQIAQLRAALGMR